MITVVIPVYKNKELFLANLKSNLKYFTGCEIIIINDYPSEGLKKDLKPILASKNNAYLIENNENLGFGPTVNKAIIKAKNKLILLLNSDVILNDDKFKSLINIFASNKNLFAASFAQIEKNGQIVGKNKYFWRRGMFFHASSNNNSSLLNGWAEGGACLMDKEKFLNLKGFDPLFSPFYWEDIDLSYRAWKAGYQILFEPKIQAVHEHESTIGKYFTKEFTKTIAFRNQFIFIWKNITAKSLIASHIFLIPFNLFYYGLLKKEFSVVKGFFMALGNIGKIIKAQKNYSTLIKVDDLNILKLFDQ